MRPINYLTLSMWWFTHSLKVGALKVTYGGVTHLTQVVGVVALLKWELGQLVIYGASGEVTLTLNMVAQVTQVIICRRVMSTTQPSCRCCWASKCRGL